MRSLLSFSAGMLLSLIGGMAVAAPPTTVFDVGSFSSAVITPDADAAAIDMAARVVLAERAPVAKSLDFGPSRATSLRDGRRIVKLPQMYAGLPVMNRSATVTFDSTGVAHIFAAKLANDLPIDVTPSVDAATAAATATQYAGAVADPQLARLVIWPGGDGERLAWQFHTPSIMGLPYAPVTVVDAKNGAVLAFYNAARTLHQAEVFSSNPVKSPQLVTVTLPLPEGATTLSDEFVTAQNCIDTKTLTPISGVPDGVHICDMQQTAIADPMTLDFVDKPAADDKPEDPFAELHIYHHTRVAYDFFRSFDPTFKVQDAPIDAVANFMQPLTFAAATDPNIPLEPFSNAFFSPDGLSNFGIMGAAIVFGQGPIKDYAYDADVIYHEFTHAVVYATLDFVGTAHHDKFGISVSPSGMNEAIADYFAAAITGDPNMGEYAILDTDPTAQAYRNLDNLEACPSAIGGEEHQDATLFSGGLWVVRDALPVEIQRDFDLAVFSAMQAAPSGDLGYEEFANIIIAQVEMSTALGTDVAAQLEAAFTKRGILPECARIIEYQGKPMQGPLGAGSGIGVWWGVTRAAANLGDSKIGYAPGVFQAHVQLTPDTDSITVNFRSRSIDDGAYTPQVLVRIADEPIEFTLSPLAASADAMRVAPLSGDIDDDNFTMHSAKIDVKPGATNAYVMIINRSDFDGVYTDLNFTMTQVVDDAKPVVPDDGCGCKVPASSDAPIGFSLVSLAALVGFVARRRRT